MAPNGGGAPSGELADAINSAFGSLEELNKKISQEGATHFASGWAWLVHDGSKRDVISTHDADLPYKHGQKAHHTIDVWEHAYNMDRKSNRLKSSHQCAARIHYCA